MRPPKSAPKAGPPPKKRWVRRLKRTLWASTAIFLGLFIAFGAYVWSVFTSLEPKVALLQKKQAELRMHPTEILSADGKLLARLANERREPVSYPEIPKVVIDTTVAAEDKRFWEHSGVDFTAILRAVAINLRSGSVRQGGSTITQQVAKRLLTSGERTFRRKIEDACLALQIERQYTKEQIIELYLNQVFYGSQAYGIKAAAEVYFGKPLNKLTLGEAALLARLPRRPSDENPFVDPEAAKTNRDIVLQIMLEENMISSNEYEKAKSEKLKLATPKPVQQIGIMQAPYFTTWILEQLRRELPNEDWVHGGYRVYTTLNTEAQKACEDALEDTIRKYRRRRVTEGAIVVMNLDGEIIALVGGSDFKKSQYNNITQGRRQPGSAFKPFVYATGLDMGVIRPNSSISNAPFYIMDKGKRRAIKGGGSGGRVSVRTALTASINTPAVRLCDEVGPSNVARFAEDVFGIRSPLYPVPVLALGSSAVRPLEMAQGYSVFATNGNRVTPFGIRRVVGPDGTVILAGRPRVVPNVLSKSTTVPMNEILRSVVTSGTGRNASSVLNAHGKTGTTSSFKDAWFCGFTDQLIAIAWVANATYDPTKTPPYKYGEMEGVFGGQVSASMWAAALRPIQKLIGEERVDRKRESFDEYDISNTIGIRICSVSGLRATSGCPSTTISRVSREEARNTPYCNLHAPVPNSGPEETPAPEPSPPDETLAEPPNGDPPPAPDTRPAAAKTVRVEICVETGLRATTYCRLKRLQTFTRGKEPTEYCHVHRP